MVGARCRKLGWELSGFTGWSLQVGGLELELLCDWESLVVWKERKDEEEEED
jgi:hypothetical protein